MKVWVVTIESFWNDEGIGSKNVESIFSSEEAAEAYAKKRKEEWSDCDFEVEEFIVNS